LRAGATLAARPRDSASRIHKGALLAVAHLWLLQNRPHLLAQVFTVAGESRQLSC
jgi:hypothetical protein